MDSKVLQIIKVNKCTIRLEAELRIAHFPMWIEASFRNAFGLFSPTICENSIFLFNSACPDDSVDYVLAHEFGHYMSCRLSYGVHKFAKSKDIQAIKGNYNILMAEEEYRADTFAVALSSKLGFDIPLWVKTNRLNHYSIYISEQRRIELDAEIHIMLSEAFYSLEQAA